MRVCASAGDRVWFATILDIACAGVHVGGIVCRFGAREVIEGDLLRPRGATKGGAGLSDIVVATAANVSGVTRYWCAHNYLDVRLR